MAQNDNGNELIIIDEEPSRIAKALARIGDIEDSIDPKQLKTINTIKKEMGLPVRATTDDMAKYPKIIVMRSEPSKAFNPETREDVQGFLLLWRPFDRKEYFMTFVGGTVLNDTLIDISPPFVTRVAKVGRAWQFVDP